MPGLVTSGSLLSSVIVVIIGTVAAVVVVVSVVVTAACGGVIVPQAVRETIKMAATAAMIRFIILIHSCLVIEKEHRSFDRCSNSLYSVSGIIDMR